MDLNPFARLKLRRETYKKKLLNEDKIKKEREKRKKREEFIKSIDPKKGTYI